MEIPSDHSSTFGMATSDTQANAAEAHSEHLTMRKLQLARLQDLLEQISQQLGTSEHSSGTNEADSPVAEESSNYQGVSESLASSFDTVIRTSAPHRSAALMPILEGALEKTSNLFTVEPPRSPGAEKQMSYSLNVNAKYHTHMDDAPARAAELEKDLKAAKSKTEGLMGLVEECKVIAVDLARIPSVKKSKYQPAVAIAVSDDEFIPSREGDEVKGGAKMGQGGRVQGKARMEDRLTLEERMKNAEIKSERFI